MAEMAPCWQVIGQPHVRTSVLRVANPGSPDLTGTDTAAWLRWVREVWAEPGVAEAITHASPALAEGTSRHSDQACP